MLLRPCISPLAWIFAPQPYSLWLLSRNFCLWALREPRLARFFCPAARFLWQQKCSFFLLECTSAALPTIFSHRLSAPCHSNTRGRIEPAPTRCDPNSIRSRAFHGIGVFEKRKHAQVVNVSATVMLARLPRVASPRAGRGISLYKQLAPNIANSDVRSLRSTSPSPSMSPSSPCALAAMPKLESRPVRSFNETA